MMKAIHRFVIALALGTTFLASDPPVAAQTSKGEPCDQKVSPGKVGKDFKGVFARALDPRWGSKASPRQKFPIESYPAQSRPVADIRNYGASPVTVTVPPLSSPFSLDFRQGILRQHPDGTFVLGPNGAATIYVTFEPNGPAFGRPGPYTIHAPLHFSVDPPHPEVKDVDLCAWLLVKEPAR